MYVMINLCNSQPQDVGGVGSLELDGYVKKRSRSVIQDVSSANVSSDPELCCVSSSGASMSHIRFIES